jgi:membrane protein implicated in regulation of membrane protease activity
VSFCVGLLHGLGFAGALSEVGLPASAIPLSLVSFNLGVETGQLCFVASVLALAALARRLTPRRARPRGLALVGAYVLGTAGAFWVVERTLAFS